MDPFVKKPQNGEEVEAGANPENKAASNELTTGTFDKLIYDDSKFIMATPPTIVYMPSEELLKKMMRVVSRNKTVDGMMKEFIFELR